MSIGSKERYIERTLRVVKSCDIKKENDFSFATVRVGVKSRLCKKVK